MRRRGPRARSAARVLTRMEISNEAGGKAGQRVPSHSFRDERLTIRHDAGSSAAPYVAGTLLAIRRVGGIKGLIRGLDALIE